MEVFQEKPTYPPVILYSTLPVIQASQVRLTRRESSDSLAMVKMARRQVEETGENRWSVRASMEKPSESLTSKPDANRVQYRRMSHDKDTLVRLPRRASEPAFNMSDVTKKLHIAKERKASTLETDKVTTIQPLQPSRPVTVSEAAGKRLITYANKRYMETNPISTRGGSLASPLAQYGDDFSSLFSPENNARIFRTPVRTTSPRFSFGSSLQVPLSNTTPRATLTNKLPGSTLYDTYESSSPGVSPAVSANESTGSKSSAGGRKSALRNPNDPTIKNNRAASGRLRVSFAKSPDVKNNLRLSFQNNMTSPRSQGQCGPEKPVKDIVRPISKIKAANTMKLHKGSSSDIFRSTPAVNSEKGSYSDVKHNNVTPESRCSDLPRKTDTTMPKRDGDGIPHLRHRKDAVSLTAIEATAIGSGVPVTTVMALTADQILVRKSVEKVQRWIDTLPRHFSTIHHVMSPVQQDY